jgi:DNA polymerase
MFSGPLYEIARDTRTCRRCPRHSARKQAVPGSGPIGAPIFLVGEAPGWNEDRTGDPFVGKSGKKLDEWLKKVGLRRSDLFITNVLKCWGGRGVPFPDDDDPGGPAERCLPFLQDQLDVVKPLAIIVAGRRALHHMILRETLEVSNPFAPWAGRVCRRRDRFGDTRIGVIWHPAKILREFSPRDERRCVDVLERIAAYVSARQTQEPAPLDDLYDIRPGSAQVYQQRFRLFGTEEDAQTFPE